MDVAHSNEVVKDGEITTTLTLAEGQLVMLNGSDTVALSVHIVDQEEQISTTLYVQVVEKRVPVALDSCMLSTVPSERPTNTRTTQMGARVAGLMKHSTGMDELEMVWESRPNVGGLGVVWQRKAGGNDRSLCLPSPCAHVMPCSLGRPICEQAVIHPQG